MHICVKLSYRKVVTILDLGVHDTRTWNLSEYKYMQFQLYITDCRSSKLQDRVHAWAWSNTNRGSTYVDDCSI